MVSNSDAPPAVQPPAPAGPPQRQSCDRCHRQKLRCIRNKNSEVCDRCLSKRAKCVFSSSLPKGRPSLGRLAVDSPKAGNTAEADSAASANEIARPISKSRPTSSNSVAPPILPQLMDTSMDTPMNTSMDTSMNTSMDTSIDMSMYTWPWIGATNWEQTQAELNWDGLDLSRAEVDGLFANTSIFEGEGGVREDSDPFSLIQSSSTPSPTHPRTYTYGLSGIGNHERKDSSTRSTMDKSIGGIGTSMAPEKNSSVVIGQLSQLSVQLSALRSLSQTLAQTAGSSFGRGPNDASFPLIDPATFESVAAWLAHEEHAASTNSRRSSYISADIPNPWPISAPQIQPESGPNILRDVFSASHQLMEIIRHLQADDIIRHLVMACEAQLLEIYASILTVLQHEAYPADFMNATALGNVRLVLVVQLCGYMIERQHLAVGQCLAPEIAQKHSPSNLLPSGPIHLGTPDLEDLKGQVQQKLTCLRQMLRCA